MNKVMLIGRLTAEPEVVLAARNTKIARYTLAVERQYKNKDGEKLTDFISCLAIGHNGKFAEKYLTKGMKIGVIGCWQTGMYKDKNGNKVKSNDCLVETHEFIESNSHTVKNNCFVAKKEIKEREKQEEIERIESAPFIEIESLENDFPFQ